MKGKSKTRKTGKTRKTRKKTKRIFSKSDYSSGDGFLTSVWGPPAWFFLHTISFNYPVNPTKEQKKQYRNFIYSLQDVLPCGHCRENLKENLKKLPLTDEMLENRCSFSKYMYNLHELVNKRLGKTSGLTYQDVKERFEHFRSRCTLDEAIQKIKMETEKGCVEPLYGKKAKCLLKIVPQEQKGKTLEIDRKCLKTRSKK